MTLTATFDFDRSTKNTHRYNEVESPEGAPHVVGTLYVSKAAVGNQPPATIVATFEVVTDAAVA